MTMIRQTRPSRPARRQTARGVSLVEALVAMAVMAFGMLAVVGTQATLRMNADIAKQRSEATRIAEEELERLRSFKGIAAVADATLDWDEVGTVMGGASAMVVANTTYTVDRAVVAPAGSAQKSMSITVRWQDRYGSDQAVVLRHVLAGAAPVLSGLLSVPATRAAPSLRINRHPTIPVRAHDLGNGESVFKPIEGGTVAWTFNNITGVITSVCVVGLVSTSASLTVADLSACTATAAQLLSGGLRFNLRGSSKDLGGGTSVFKPVAGGTVAWVIDHASSSIVRRCQVSPASSTASLTAADVAPGPGCTSVNQAISPFDPVNDPSHAMVAADAEAPQWPALPLSIALSLVSTGHPLPPACFTDAPTSAVAANSQFAAEYFCIVFPNPSKTWSGKSLVSGEGFSDGGGSPWSIGAATGSYRVCRYTTAPTDVTENANHPRDYVDAFGNLINQNFLVVAGPKSCPTDVAADPAAGDLVNTNTLPHQP